MKSVWLFSEIHPRGPVLFQSVFNAAELSQKYDLQCQAQAWYGLGDLKTSNGSNFVEIVQAIAEGASRKNRTVVLRSWSHIDFLGRPFTEPSGVNELVVALDDYFDLKHFGVFRHPIDQWASMMTRWVYQDITLNDYLVGYKKFIEQPCISQWQTYESFVAEPNGYLQDASRVLNVDYDPDWSRQWQANLRITGDRMASGSGVGEIKLGQKRQIDESLLQQFWESEIYQEILAATGYRHPDFTWRVLSKL